jgi:hypothetical protein
MFALTRSWPRSADAIVAGLTLLALGLRLACLGQSPFGDELFLFAIVHDHSLGQVLSIVHDTEKTPPLGFLLSWLFAHGDDADVLVRIPSLLASVATVPLAYALGVRTVGRGAGVFAAAWLAIAPFQIFYGTESRSYALAAALALLSTLALLAAVRRPHLWLWVLYALAATAAIYTHYIAALVLIPQAVWALWAHRDTVRGQLLAGAAVVLAFLPWLPSFIVQVRHSDLEAAVIDAIAPLTPEKLIEISGRAMAGHPFISLRELFGIVPLIAIAAAVAAALAYRLWRWRRVSPERAVERGQGTGGRDSGRGRLRAALADRRALLVIGALAPLVGVALYSAQPDTSFLLPRNISVAVPYAALLLGSLLVAPRPRVAVALCGVAVAALAVGTVRMLEPELARPDGRDAAAYIDSHVPPTAPVIDVGFAAFESPPAAATRVHLERPHPIYSADESDAAWARAARTGSPVFVTFLDPSRLAEVIPGIEPPDPDRLGPPPALVPGFELVAEHVSEGLIPIFVREYLPR